MLVLSDSVATDQCSSARHEITMLSKWLVVVCCAFMLPASLGDEPRRATVYLFGNGISGTVVFSEVEGGLRLTGTITGMDEGKYGFHIHEVGDISNCDNTAGHFDPHGNDHGGQDHEMRHVGDLGNVEFDTQKRSQIDILEPLMTLRGENSILGRALVLHVQEDDLGLGGHPDSLVTGNAGARAACGVVGVLSPVTPWNAAGAVSSPYLLLLVVSALFLAIRL